MRPHPSPSSFAVCRGDPIRTGDPLVPNQMRYQLRHAPIFFYKCIRECTIFVEIELRRAENSGWNRIVRHECYKSPLNLDFDPNKRNNIFANTTYNELS